MKLNIPLVATNDCFENEEKFNATGFLALIKAPLSHLITVG